MRGIIVFFAIAFFVCLQKPILAQAPFHRGVNLSEWFQANNASELNFSKYTKQDFINIKSLGCDVIRLPISMNNFTSGKPDYKFDPLYFIYLDSAITWAENLKLYLVLDNHSFDAAISAGPVLIKVWEQMAEHYKDRSKYILYEILNEPHDLPTKDWAAMQQDVIDVIRKKDTRHTIIVGPSSYNHYTELKNLPIFADTNLLYTFHFYDPFIFTHQGADWVGLQTFKGVPYPYDAERMPVRNVAKKGTWGDSLLSVYKVDGTAQKIKSLIDIAINFRTVNHVNIYCGEFGANIPNTDKKDRVLWHKTVSEYLAEKGIPWTLWDYHGGFGLFNKDMNGQFNVDLNIPLLKALDLNVPGQKRSDLLNHQTIKILPNNKYQLESKFLKIIVDANDGGKIASFKLGEFEMLSPKSVHPGLYGSTLWLSPQKFWMKHPLDELENGIYTTEITNRSLKLQSLENKKVGLKFEKEFNIDSVNQCINILYSIKNISKSAISLAPWEVTRLPKGGQVIFPLGDYLDKTLFDANDKRIFALTGADIKLPNNISINDTALWYTISEKGLVEKDKIFCDGREGWSAYVYKGYVFIKVFEDIPVKKIPESEGEIEVYTATKFNYIELEQNGLYAELKPEDTMNWHVKWCIRQLPYEMNYNNEKSKLLSFIRNTIIDFN